MSVKRTGISLDDSIFDMMEEMATMLETTNSSVMAIAIKQLYRRKEHLKEFLG